MLKECYILEVGISVRGYDMSSNDACMVRSHQNRIDLSVEHKVVEIESGSSCLQTVGVSFCMCVCVAIEALLPIC